jgi:alkanesulfonate monooxygenase SsuD/methylene tetrahydromethanopterin reductase-like flavin-dependent oxidoreductase (luciferase family)
MNAGDTSSYSRISQIARHAEDLGFDSLWVTEREPFPHASNAGCRSFTGEVVVSRRAIDQVLDALAIAAINTERIALGVNLPNVPFYSPYQVGRSLAALDELSDGRVRVGFGLGWSATEFTTVGSSLNQPETPAGEFVRALETVVAGYNTGFRGDYFVIPSERSSSSFGSRSRHRQLPVMLTAFAPAAVQQPAVLLRGGSPLLVVQSSDEMADALAAATPGRFDLTVRAVVRLTDGPIGESRSMFSGSLEQIRDDVAFVADLGASEIQFDLGYMPAAQQTARLLEMMAVVRELPAVSPLNAGVGEARQRVAA